MEAFAQPSRGLMLSAALHIFLLIALIFGLPSFLHHQIDPEPEAVSIDILPIAPMSNVKPAEKAPEKPVEKKPVAQEQTARKETPEAQKEVPEEEDRPAPAIVPKKTVKKAEKKQQKPKKKSEDLESVLKSVKESAKAEASKQPTEKAATPTQKQAVSQNYNPAVPLSMSEKDAIRNQIQKYWDVPAGAKDAYNLVVTLHIELASDGSVLNVELSADQGRYNSDPFFRAAADSAIRAVRRSSPLKDLPADKFDTWHDIELGFNPKDMLY